MYVATLYTYYTYLLHILQVQFEQALYLCRLQHCIRNTHTYSYNLHSTNFDSFIESICY